MRDDDGLTRGDRIFRAWLVVITLASLIWWFAWAPEDFPAKGTVAGAWIGGAYVLWRARLSDRGRWGR